jgi:hypothetical protein
MTTVVIVISIVATLAVLVWFLRPRNHPEDAATHGDEPPTTTADELYRGSDAPAGPDAEVMDPERLGGDLRPPE